MYTFVLLKLSYIWRIKVKFTIQFLFLEDKLQNWILTLHQPGKTITEKNDFPVIHVLQLQMSADMPLNISYVLIGMYTFSRTVKQRQTASVVARKPLM